MKNEDPINLKGENYRSGGKDDVAIDCKCFYHFLLNLTCRLAKE